MAENLDILRRVPLIKGIDPLTLLCTEFACWYNAWRPHMTLEGLRPDHVYDDNKPKRPRRDSKTVPCHIERHVFAKTRLTGGNPIQTRERTVDVLEMPGSVTPAKLDIEQPEPNVSQQ